MARLRIYEFGINVTPRFVIERTYPTGRVDIWYTNSTEIARDARSGSWQKWKDKHGHCVRRERGSITYSRTRLGRVVYDSGEFLPRE